MTIVAGILTLPSALLRTPKLLSYLSMVGTFATVSVVSSVVISALCMFFTVGDSAGVKKEEYALYSSSGLPLAMGIVAYCFSGHAIVPSIYNSMQRPHEFERMIDLTYGVVLSACLLVAISGYYMFGNDVEDQITLSLEKRAGDGNLAMDCLTWLMILTACSKFTLTMFPLALGFEEMLTNILPSDLAMELVDSIVKLVLIFLALAVAIWFPSFSFLCSLVGLICTLIVSVIFPAWANMRLFGPSLSTSEKVAGWLLVVGGAFVAIVGTIATVKADM
jgi:vesicular inhibitory amino acid transporter